MGSGAAAVTVLSAVLSVTAPAPGARSISLAASFVLKTIDAQGTDVVSGAVSFVPGGEVCVAVRSPNVQEMHLTTRELTIYYPDRDLAFVAHFEPPQPPPMLDALAAGIVDPASTLPPQSKLIERKQRPGEPADPLARRRRVGQGGGRDAGGRVARWRALPRAPGSLGQAAAAVHLRRSDPRRARTACRAPSWRIISLPAAVQKREEQWSLADVAPLDPRRPVAIGCARLRPQTKIQALSW